MSQVDSIKSGALSATVQIQIPFHDVDMARIVWHGRYPKYFEVARTELFAKLGYDFDEMIESGYGWPVIDMRVRYVGVIVYKQTIRVEAKIVEWENCLKIAYTIYDEKSGTRLTKGSTTQAAINLSNNELCLQTPAVLQDKIKRLIADV